jgi:ABC-type uncharacterized transport system involved in gliding motility auxiliary subunit
MSPRTGRTRGSLLLTTLLVAGLGVEANRLLERLPAGRVDLSEDGLYGLSPVTRRVLAQLEDTLSVHAFFTAEVESGRAAIEKARVEAQLEELRALAGGRMLVDVRDPSVDSQAELDARTHGLQARPVQASQGTGVSRQLVHRSLLLRYRGRTERVAWAEPWTLEADVVGAVARMLRDRRPRVGWAGESFDTDPRSSWQLGSYHGLRAQLARRLDLVPVASAELEAGEPVPDDLDALVVVQPLDWHPRAVFAVEQAIQAGVPALLLLDSVQMHAHAEGQRAVHAMRGDPPSPTGFEALTRAWGAPLVPGHVWDAGWAGRRGVLVAQLGADGRPTGSARREELRTPAVIEVARAGMSATFPPTAGLEGVAFGWAQPFAEAEPPPGVTRLDPIHSSDEAWVVELVEALVKDASVLEARTATLRRDPRRRSALATVLTGTLPSPFRRGAPEPLDLIGGGEGGGVTGEPVLDGASSARVVLVGDADFVRDRDPYELLPGLDARSLLLFENLLDWLLADEDLISLRSRLPRTRPLRDLLEEELDAEGLLDAGLHDTVAELSDRARRRAAAERRAEAGRWGLMGAPVGVSLGLVLLFGLVWNQRERRRR